MRRPSALAARGRRPERPRARWSLARPPDARAAAGAAATGGTRPARASSLRAPAPRASRWRAAPQLSLVGGLAVAEALAAVARRRRAHQVAERRAGRRPEGRAASWPRRRRIGAPAASRDPGHRRELSQQTALPAELSPSAATSLRSRPAAPSTRETVLAAVLERLGRLVRALAGRRASAALRAAWRRRSALPRPARAAARRRRRGRDLGRRRTPSSCRRGRLTRRLVAHRHRRRAVEDGDGRMLLVD